MSERGRRCGQSGPVDAAHGDCPASTTRVELSAPAREWVIGIVRALATDLTTRADFDLDSIADIQIAVDEACTALVALAARDAVLSCRLLLDSDHMRVHVRVRASDRGARVNTTGFGWHVLTSLVNELNTVSPADGGDQLEIHFVKRSVAR